MSGALLAAVGILAVAVFGAMLHYFHRFSALRRKIIDEVAKLAKDGPVIGGTKFAIMQPLGDHWVANARSICRELSTDLASFRQNEPVATWVASRRYDLNKLQGVLEKLSGSITGYGVDKLDKETVFMALRAPTTFN